MRTRILLVTSLVLLLANLVSAGQMENEEPLKLYYLCSEVGNINVTLLCEYDLATSVETAINLPDGVTFDLSNSRVLANRTNLMIDCVSEGHPLAEFCLLDHDGGNLEIIQSRAPDNTSATTAPVKMNQNGDIIYICSPYHESNINVICAVDRDQPDGFRILTPEGYNVIRIDMNDSGKIAFTCQYLFHEERTLPDLFWTYQTCEINFDGTGFRTLNDPIANPGLWIGYARVSESGVSVFECLEYDKSTGATIPSDFRFCHYDSDQNLQMAMKSSSSGGFDFDIYGSDNILYFCRERLEGEDRQVSGFCTMKVDGSGSKFAELTVFPRDRGVFDATSDGLMAFQCAIRGDLAGTPSSADLCVVDSEGTLLHRIEDETPRWRGDPVFNR